MRIRGTGLWIIALLAGTVAAVVADTTRQEGVIPAEAMGHEQGFCYTARIETSSPPDSNSGGASFLRLFEDDLELGPPHAMHQTVRDSGGGVFSHWSAMPVEASQVEALLYFSASDNTDPRTNGRTYKWVTVLDAAGNPVPASVGLLTATPCRLAAVPGAALTRDRHTTLLASFDATESSHAEYARVERREVGMGSQPDAPGRFGNGVAVTNPQGAVRFAGLDNYNPRVGTVEFWAQSRPEAPIWADGKEHWLLVLYPERAAASPRYGMSPFFVALRKSAENELDLRVVAQAVAHYSIAPGLRTGRCWSLRLPVKDLPPDAWHHLLISWDLRGKGRLWLTVDGEGQTAPIGLRPPSPAPNPGMAILLGGLWGLPGDEVAASGCNLDDLRIQDCTVAERLAGAVAQPGPEVDQARLLIEEDAARTMLDKLIELQFHGGWAAGYNWPTYSPSGWSLVGRGVDMWFQHSAFAAQALLRGWLTWGDERYLDTAIEAADMFCRTQMANGSWAYHYTYSRGEFQPWGEQAYIAQAMQSNQIRFLGLMYRLLGYERYGEAIRRAGDWMVSIQFPNGAWGWEAYPVSQTGPYGHPALNDAITPQAMSDLFVIWCATGDRKYLDPVLRGADWIVSAQAGPPTSGWADQYDQENHLIWMRNFEPPAVSMQAISAAVWGLTLAYDLSCDPKYLEPLRKVLAWLDQVPEDQRGWLWYDPDKSVPVVAYYNEMLPVTDPKAIKEYIPRLDAHYGTKFAWQADAVRLALKAREAGPVYPDARGLRPSSDFASGGPTREELAATFAADPTKGAREQLVAWAAGAPLSGILGGAYEYGRTFEIGNAIGYTEALLGDIERGRVALGDIALASIPRFARGGASNWTYMEPTRNYYATPLSRYAPQSLHR